MAAALLCILFLLCQIAASNPTLKLKDGNKQASVPLTKRLYTNATLPSKNSQLVATYSKLNLPVPPAVQQAWDQEQEEKKNGSTLSNRNNGFLEKRLEGQQTSTSAGYYVFPVAIGTPPNVLHVLVDTGSSDLWTWGVGMTQFGFSLTGHNYYNQTASSTSAPRYQADGVTLENFEVCYGSTGSVCVLAHMGTDVVLIDWIEVSGLPVPWIYWQDVSLWGDLGVDGIFGLALAPHNAEYPDPEVTWQGFVLPLLGDFVGFTLVFKNTGDSNIDFAWIDDAKYTGELTYTPVVESFAGWEYWAFVWDGFSIGTGTYNTTKFPVLTDTGNPYASFPQSIVDAWQSQVVGGFEYYSHFVFPCTATLPSFVVGVGSARFTLPGSIFNAGYYGSTADGVDYCWSLFFSIGSDDFAALGMPFLESLFVVYDVGNHQMGFGNNTGL